MIVKIIHDFPSWYVILCMFSGLGYAALLYYKNSSDGFSGTLIWFLAVFRFLLVSILAFLLLSPLLERVSREQEDPLLLFVQDNSSSLITGAETLDPEAYLSDRQFFLSQMQEQFDVRRYTFGEQFAVESEVDFSERLTDISAVFRGVNDRYSRRNIGAMILVSDGIYNHGINPLYAMSAVDFPVYTLAMGDTLPKRDVIVRKVDHNRITYLGNRFPLEVMIEALGCEGTESVLSIVEQEEVVHEQTISFTSDHHVERVLLELEASSPGLRSYEAILSPAEGELSLSNNRYSFFIEVIDSRQKILLLAHAPHPDVAAISGALENHQQYEVEVSLFRDFKGSYEAWNLIILHQLPAAGTSLDKLIQIAREASLPLLYIIGQQTDLERLNHLNAVTLMQLRSSEFTEALPAINEPFALFGVPRAFLDILPDMPPLLVPFATYEQKPAAEVMLRQQVGSVQTEQPLIAFSRSAESKTGFIMGEGVWRWRMHAFMRTGDHRAFDETFSAIAQYLALHEDTRPFRVNTPTLVYEHEPVLMEAELYNPSYERVNTPDVHITLSNEEGEEWSFNMSRTADAYQLDAGRFPPGAYRFRATTRLAGEDYTHEGAFRVAPLQLESVQTRANHQLLFQMADRSGAEIFYPDQWEDLQNHILERDDIHPLMYSRRSFTGLIDHKILFLLLMLLLAAEWFLRKRNGSY